MRSHAPPDTLGGGTDIDPRARRHGRRSALIERLERLARGEPELPDEPVRPARAPADQGLGPRELALADRLLAARHEPLSAAELGDAACALPALRAAGLAVRIGRDLYAHPDALAAVHERVVDIVRSEGTITLARLRDELQTSRKYAQALLEHLDAARVTKRLPDDRRILRKR